MAMSAAIAGDSHGVEDDVEVGRSCIAVAPPPARLVADEELSAEEDEKEEGAVGTSSTAALAVAATAAVELTNLFFFLHGDAGRAVAPRRRGRRCGEMCLLPVELVEAVTVILALAAFLSAAGLLLLQHAADLGHHRIVSPACSTAVLVASTAALFLASLGTVFLLLHDDQTVL